MQLLLFDSFPYLSSHLLVLSWKLPGLLYSILISLIGQYIENWNQWWIKHVHCYMMPMTFWIYRLAVQGICGCDRFKSGSIGDVFRTIVRKDGYKGLVRGWAPRMLFHAPAAAICWSTYEASKTFFQELNGSSSNSGTVTWITLKYKGDFAVALPILLYDLQSEFASHDGWVSKLNGNFQASLAVYFTGRSSQRVKFIGAG